MSDETPGAATLAAPPTPPVPEPVDAPIEESAPEPEGAGETDTAVSEAPPAAYTLPQTYEELEEALKGHEELSSAYQARLDETRKTAQSETQKRLQPLYERTRQNTQQLAADAQRAANGIGELLGTVKKFEEQGYVETGTFAQAIAQHAPEFGHVLANLTSIKGQYDGIGFLMSSLAPESFETYRDRLNQAQLSAATADEVKLLAQDWFDSTVEEREKKAEEKGYRRGLKEGSGASTAVAKGQIRGKGGPDTAQATSGGTSVRNMAEADHRYTLPEGHPDKMSHADYKAARERFGIK
jgi:hypothetical protein